MMSAALVFHLWHAHRLGDSELCEKTIGFCRSRADAEAARERAAVLPGFVDAADDFLLEAHGIGRDRWIDGFAGWSPGFKREPARPLDEASAAPLALDGVFVLYHARASADVWLDDDARLVGLYASRAEADAAQARAARRPGFRDAPGAFTIDRYRLGEDHWTTGYITS